MDKLYQAAREILAKIILAADESTKTIVKRLASIGLESTPEINRQYRQLLFTTPGIERYISSVILHDETIRQSTDEGAPFPHLLSQKRIVPGIKVDQGTEQVGQTSDTVTKGLGGLEKRLDEYKNLGARFTKWRAAFTIRDNFPSEETIVRNASDLAHFAKICQGAELVPIVEPEVLMDGTHSIEKTKEVTEHVLTAVFAELQSKDIDFRAMILKPNMITAGKESPQQNSIDEVARITLEVLQKTVPTDVSGIAFLSGGQNPDLATNRLQAMNKIKNAGLEKYPWKLTASYGRALQEEALKAWGGKKENIVRAQAAFVARAEKVYKAGLGQL